MKFVKRNLNIFLIFIISQFCVFSAEDKTGVIVDTDMGLDDARAIILMLCTDKIDIEAIVTSDGSASPEAGCRNAQILLQNLNRERVPIGMGRTLNAPMWREKSNTLGWSKLIDSIPSATGIILQTLKRSDKPMTYICIGPMTNLADALQSDESIANHIARVLYFGKSPFVNNSEWNTQRDIESAKKVYSSNLPIWEIFPNDSQQIPFDMDLYDRIGKINTIAADLIVQMHRDQRVQDLFGTKHSTVWDETIALFLEEPRLITVRGNEDSNPVFRFGSWDKGVALLLYLEMLEKSPKIQESGMKK